MDPDKAAENDPGASTPGSFTRAKDAVVAASSQALESGLAAVAVYKDGAADLASHARDEAVRSASDVASHVAEGVRGVAGDLAEKGAGAASAATARARSLADDLEARARSNPLGAIASAFAIGLLGRR
jgi:hypothetical protein